MRNRIVMIPFSLWMALSANAVFGQDDPEQAERARAAQQETLRREAMERANEEIARRERERYLEELRKVKPDIRTEIESANRDSNARRAMEQQARLDRFRNALTAFEAARKELLEALGLKARLKDPAKKLEKSAALFLDLLRPTSKEPRFDPSEFKDFTPAELGWEALTTAERLAPQLAAVILIQRERIVDVRFLASLSKLQSELLRLRWMTQKLK